MLAACFTEFPFQFACIALLSLYEQGYNCAAEIVKHAANSIVDNSQYRIGINIGNTFIADYYIGKFAGATLKKTTFVFDNKNTH